MNLNKNRRFLMRRPVALLITASMAIPLLLTGCGGKKDETPGTPVDDTKGGTVTPTGPKMAPPKTGMSTEKKVIILAGAAAAYYWYVHHKKAEQNADKQEYFISKANGRIYYRDASHTARYVTPPTAPVQVDESEAPQYSHFKGYNNQTTGDDLQAATDAQ